MLFIWALDTKKKELTGTEVMAGPCARFQKSMVLALVLLVDYLWPRKFSDSLIRLF